jgi:site-specific DNA recombinase
VNTGQHVGIYARISQDKNKREEGVTEQIRWGREYAEATWPSLPVVVYSDNDMSGLDDDRPDLLRMHEAICAGECVQVVTSWKDRLTRSYIWFQMGPQMLAAGVEKIHTKHDGIVEVGSLLDDLMTVLNFHEIKKMKAKLMDRLNANAAQGESPGSKPFGYVHGFTDKGAKTYIQVPDQADAIQWAAEKVLAGWSLSSVAAEWRKRGLVGAHGGKLSAGSVRSALTKPTVAGWRVHSGEVVGRGNWDAILPEATWQACRAKLAAPRSVERTDGGTYPVGPAHSGYSGRVYALTGGLLVCGKPVACVMATREEVVCGAPMVGSLKQLGKRKGQAPKRVVPYFLCHPNRGGMGCTGIMAGETEAEVERQLWAELDKPEFLESYDEDAHEERRNELINKLAGVDARRLELADAYSDPDGDLTMAEYQRARAGLKASERKLQEQLRAIPAAPPRIDIAEARASRELMTLGEWREFIRLYIDQVTVLPARPGAKGFDPARVKVHFIEPAGGFL